jgi:hypothetical protein
MSIDKISSIAIEEKESTLAIIRAHLIEQGENEESAQRLMEEYQAKFAIE